VMPTYEYVCECGTKQESFYCRPELAPELLHCPFCGLGMKRQIGPGSCVIFRGDGFYCNDSKKSSPKNTEDR